MSDGLIGSGNLNSRDGSNVDVKVAAEPLAFLRPETGEVIIVPAEDANTLRSHYNGLSDMVAEFHSANRAVQLCVEYLQDLEIKGASAVAKHRHVSHTIWRLTGSRRHTTSFTWSTRS